MGHHELTMEQMEAQIPILFMDIMDHPGLDLQEIIPTMP